MGKTFAALHQRALTKTFVVMRPRGPAMRKTFAALHQRGPAMGKTFGALLALAFLVAAPVAEAHPMGNFSISRYSGLTVEPESIELRYLVDMAEIPTFQEIQESGIVAEAGHPGLDGYLAQKAEALKAGLALELNGRRLVLRNLSRTARFSPGAGDLPTMKLGF